MKQVKTKNKNIHQMQSILYIICNTKYNRGNATNKFLFLRTVNQYLKLSIAGCLLSSFHCPSLQIRELLKNFNSNADVGSGVLS